MEYRVKQCEPKFLYCRTSQSLEYGLDRRCLKAQMSYSHKWPRLDKDRGLPRGISEWLVSESWPIFSEQEAKHWDTLPVDLCWERNQHKVLSVGRRLLDTEMHPLLDNIFYLSTWLSTLDTDVLEICQTFQWPGHCLGSVLVDSLNSVYIHVTHSTYLGHTTYCVHLNTHPSTF